MPYFGAHMSIAGGVQNALLIAEKFGCDCVQLFTKNASQWKGKELSDTDRNGFSQHLKRIGLKFPTAHDSYLINLAASDEALYRKSIEAFVEEMERAEFLGLKYLVMHPGAHVGHGEETGLQRVAAALDEILERCADYKVQILIETTAGQGTTLGHRFEQIATILDRVQVSSKLGVCLDTCHIFAAGYSLATEADYKNTFQQFDDLIGLKRLKLFHINDSVKGCGSRVDRHAGLGKGQIGLLAFRLLVNDERFRKHPMILETPKQGPDGEAMDPVNLAVLRNLIEYTD